MFTNLGYQKFTPFKVSDYIKDSSEFDWNGESLNAPEVNYFDRNFMFTNLGYQKFTPFKVSDYIKDSSEFDWNGESLNAPEVDYFDQTKQYTAFGYQKFTPFKVSDYIKDASEFDWNGTSVNAPEVDYFDQTKQYTAFGYQKFTPFKVSDYIPDASEFDWNGESLNAPEVNFLDPLRRHTIFGFQKLTPMYVSDYRKDSSRFDWDGETKDAPEVDYFDQNKRNTTRGYQKFTPFKVTDYLKDTSAFVWSATSLDGPEVDYFDQNKINTTVGYKKLTRMYISDYLKDSSNFDWDGDTLDAPEVNYFDRNRVYTVKGYQKLVSMLSSDYIPDSSKFDFDGNNLNAPEVNYFDRNRVYTLRGYQKLVPMLSSDYVPDSSRFDFDGGKLDAPEVNYFDVLNRYQFGFNKYAPAKISNYVPNASDFDNQELEKYRIDNKYEVLGSIYEMDPRFNSRYKEVYTKLGNARDNSYNIDLFWDEPYVIRGVGNFDQLGPEYYGIAGITYDEGFVRGGATTYASRVVEDAQRLGKYLTSSKGLMFSVRQLGMQLTNPNVETSADKSLIDTILGILVERPTQVYLPTTTLLSARGIEFGSLFIRHGLDPFGFTSVGKYEEIVSTRNSNSNENKYLSDQDEDGNRLLNLTKELFPNWLSDGFRDSLLKIGDDSYYGKEIEYLSHTSGPNSYFGFGSTIINRYSVTNVLSAEQIFTGYGPMYPAVTYHRFTSDRQYASGENLNLAIKAGYTKENDLNLHSRESMEGSAPFLNGTNELVTLSNLIEDLETFKYRSEIYHIPYTTHKIRNPFKTLGTLSYNYKNEYEYDNKQFYAEYSRNESEFRDDLIKRDPSILNSLEKRDNDLYNSKEIISNTSEFYPPKTTPKTEDKDTYLANQTRADELIQTRKNKNNHNMTSNMHTLLLAHGDINANYSSAVDDGKFTSPYLTLKYSDISYLAKTRRDNRSQFSGIEGGFSFLKYENIDKFNQYVNTDRERFDFINGLFDSNGDITPNTNEYTILKTRRSLGSQGYNRKDGFRHKRNNKYGFEFSKVGASVKTIKREGGKFAEALIHSKGDTVNLIDVVKGYQENLDRLYDDNNASDFVNLVFSTANYNPISGGSRGINSSILPFRATLKTISDTFTPDWTANSIIGRGDSAYMYGGYERAIQFDFIVVATTLEEHYTNWRKLNELASFTTPDYGNDGNQRMLGPVLRLTIGDLYLGVPGFITSLNYEYDFSSNVEIAGHDLDGKDLNKDKTVLALPGIIQVSVGYKIIGNYRPEKSGKIIELTNSEGNSWLGKDKRKVVQKKPPTPPPTPAPPAPPAPPPEPVLILKDVNFDSGKDTLKPEAKVALDDVATQLKLSPSVKIELVGHTDNVPVGQGSAFRDNQHLSEARANAVKAYLQSKGVTNDFITLGKGSTIPLVKNDSDRNRAINRRVTMEKLGDQSRTAMGDIKF
jgi:outer membrane protein OmpA-like peptidoglycan-associated protein